MDVEQVNQKIAGKVSLLKTLGIRLVEIGDTYAEMEVTVADIHLNYLGGAHGGLLATLADTVSFFPRPLLPSGKVCTTTTLNISYVRPALPGDRLLARADLLHLGQRLASVTCNIRNQEGKLVAHSNAILMVLEESHAPTP